jgi:uncharacterized protein YqjF (DUF2071 family)
MASEYFLSARWEYLAMLNYEVDPIVLDKYLPPFTAIDFYKGKVLVSIVGFLFNDTKVWGIKWPGHVSFEEVNLRFYIKHFDGQQWKRGVGFVSEIVPRPAIARIANILYNEKYSTAAMKHHLNLSTREIRVEYQWKKRNQEWNFIRLQADNHVINIEKDSEQEFIFEHYYGYNKYSDHQTIEYEIQHPKWQVFPVTDFEISCNVEKLYGKEFVPFIMNQRPRSVMLAKGSEVFVKKPCKLLNGINK